jgi:hypothetical protein
VAVKVSITAALEGKLRAILDDESSITKRGVASVVRQLVALVDDAKERAEKKPPGGLNPHHVINAIRGVLGSHAILPPNPSGAFYSWIKHRTNFLGVTLEDIEKAAIQVRDTWRLPATVENIVKRLDTLVHKSNEAGHAPLPAEENVTIVTGRGEWD